MDKSSLQKQKKRSKRSSPASSSSEDEDYKKRRRLNKKKREKSTSRSNEIPVRSHHCQDGSKERDGERSSGESSSSSTSEDERERRKMKKHKKMERKKRKKEKRKLRKRRKEKDEKQKEESGLPKAVENEDLISGPMPQQEEPIYETRKRHPMVPMTKEEYDKQQSKVRRVFDPETGRNRLVKGDDEIIEEAVSYQRHKQINKLATLGDGASFQKSLGL